MLSLYHQMTFYFAPNSFSDLHNAEIAYYTKLYSHCLKLVGIIFELIHITGYIYIYYNIRIKYETIIL